MRRRREAGISAGGGEFDAALSSDPVSGRKGKDGGGYVIEGEALGLGLRDERREQSSSRERKGE